MATHPPGSRPMISLFGDIVSDLAHLFQTEIQLARAELNEKLSRVANVGTVFAAGIVLSLAGLFVLLLAAVSFLALAGVPHHWGLLGVGFIAALFGIALLGRTAGS